MMGSYEMRVFLISVFFCLLFSQPVVSQDISWENKYVRKPTSNWDGSTYLFPVVEDETVLIQCKVRAERHENYKLTLKYSEDFHATTSNTTTVGPVGAEYAVVNFTVNIDNPEDIDNKEIKCFEENGNAIYLKIMAFVRDDLHCDPCDGTQSIELRRPGNQTIEDDIEKTLFQIMINTLGYIEKEVYQGPDGFVCGCKLKDPTPSPPITDWLLVVSLVSAGTVALGMVALWYWASKKRTANPVPVVEVELGYNLVQIQS